MDEALYDATLAQHLSNMDRSGNLPDASQKWIGTYLYLNGYKTIEDQMSEEPQGFPRLQR